MLFLQKKRHGPVAQIHGVGIRMFHSGSPWFIKEIVGSVPPLTVHTKVGGPFRIQRYIPLSGKLLIAPLQQQIGIV